MPASLHRAGRFAARVHGGFAVGCSALRSTVLGASRQGARRALQGCSALRGIVLRADAAGCWALTLHVLVADAAPCLGAVAAPCSALDAASFWLLTLQGARRFAAPCSEL